MAKMNVNPNNCLIKKIMGIIQHYDSDKYWKRRKGRTNRQKPLSSQCFHRPGHWMLRWLFRTWNRHFYGNGLYLFAGLFFDTRQWQCQIGKPRFQYRGVNRLYLPWKCLIFAGYSGGNLFHSRQLYRNKNGN